MQKRVTRRRFLQLSAGSAAGTLLIACGRAGSSAPSTSLGAGDRPTAASVPDLPSTAGNETPGLAFRGTAEFWDWSFDSRNDYMNKIVEAWQAKNPGIALKYNTQGYADMEAQILAAAQSGSTPPFANVHFNWRVDLQRSGLLAPYPDDMFAWEQLWSTPFNRDPATGKIYTSDFCLYTDQVYYNAKLLDAEGIKPVDIPRTWDDFMRMAAQLTRRDASGALTQAGWAFNHHYSREWLWASLVYQQGGWLWSEDGTQALWNAEAGVRALQLVQDVYHKYQVDDPGALDMFESFGTGKAAMYISQGYTGTYLGVDYPDLSRGWGTAVTPTFSGRPDPAWGLVTPEEGFCVFNSASPELQEVGFSFIKEMIGSDERRAAWALVGNGPSDSKALQHSPLILKQEAGSSITTQAETLPWRINYGERPLEAEPIWREMFDAVILKKADPKAALDHATEQMNAALKQSGQRRLFTERSYKPPTAGVGVRDRGSGAT